jgi:hypothetical protein
MIPNYQKIKTRTFIIILVFLLNLFLHESFAETTKAQRVIVSSGTIKKVNKLIIGVDYWAGFTKSYFINRDLPFLKEAGIQILRLEFGPWSEPNLVELVPVIVSNGFSILGLLIRRDLAEANDLEAWGEWVYNIVQAYKDKIKYWQIWGEPNWNTGFGAPGDPVKYVEFLKIGYLRAKQADPNCTIIAAGILGTDDPGLNFLRAIYENGAKDYMDALGYDPYCTTVSPLYPYETSTGKAFWKLQWVRDIMVQYGDGDKKIWVTEMGWASEGVNSVGEENQALYLTQALNLAKTWDWLETFIVFNWMDSKSANLYFGLVRGRYSPPYTYENFCKPAFFTVKNFTIP